MPIPHADLRHAVRLLGRNPAFSLVVILTLAVGIGLNTAVFSAVDSLLLQPLAGVRAPDELVQLYRTWPGDMRYGSNSLPHFRDVREGTRGVLAGVAAWTFESMNVSADGEPRRVLGSVASANFFAVLGASAALGRTFADEEDEGRGAHPVAVLSHTGWKGLFGGDPEVVGRTFVLNARSYTVIGVTPPGFKGVIPIASPALWVPLMQLDHIRPGEADRLFERRGSNSFSLIARLAPGVSLAVARQRLDALTTALSEEHPDDYRGTGINLVPQQEAGIHPPLRGAQVGLTTVVMAVVALLLLIACVNVANLLLARAGERAREMAVRLSLGARRTVLIRQLLTESLVLSLLGGLAGIGIAWWAMRLANNIRLPFDIDFTPGLSLSPTVLLFTLGVSVLTGVTFGLAPALQATRPSLVPALKGEASAGGSRAGTRKVLVVSQIALSILLLVSAGLFLQSLRAATRVDTGFDRDHLLTAEFDPGLQGHSRARIQEFERRLVERLEAHPGVRVASLVDRLFLSLGSNDWGISVPGYTPGPNELMSVGVARAAPGYFEAMGTPLLAGREFSVSDDTSATGVMVVNQRFAERFWPGQDPIGRVVRTGGRDRTVIGVVPTGKYVRLGEEPTAFMFLPRAQSWSSQMTVLIRTVGDPLDLVPVLRDEVAAFDPNLPVANVRSMNNHLGIALLPARLAGTVLAMFGVLGLGLALIGVYGVTSHSVAQRHREIGIRMAVGAAAGAVVRLLLREGLRLVLLGIGLGLGSALAGARLLSGLLYGTALDPATFALVPLVMGGVAILAIWIPARRAASVNPMAVLRQE